MAKCRDCVDPTDPVRMTPEQRLGEVGVILAAGVIRVREQQRAADGASGGQRVTVAMIEADIAPITDDLRRIPYVIRHSRRAKRIISRNTALSLAIRAIFLAPAIPGLASLWMAIAADTGASLLVGLNELRSWSTSDVSPRKRVGTPDPGAGGSPAALQPGPTPSGWAATEPEVAPANVLRPHGVSVSAYVAAYPDGCERPGQGGPETGGPTANKTAPGTPLDTCGRTSAIRAC